MKKITKAIIPSAGYGTRFLPITKAVPKEMLAVVDKPAIQYIIEEAIEGGITDILLIVNQFKKPVLEHYFGKNEKYDAMSQNPDLHNLSELLKNINIYYTNQEVMNGTGGAVELAKSFTEDEPFLVMYGDDVIINKDNSCAKQMIDAYYQTGKTVLGVQTRPAEEAIKYGVVKKGKQNGRLTEVLGMVEKPPIDQLPSTLCSLGRYVLTPDIYNKLAVSPYTNGEKYLTTAIDMQIKENGVWAYDFEGKRYDLGDKFGFLQANIELGLEKYGDKMTDYLKSLI